MNPSTESLAEAIARLRRALRRGARAANPQNVLAVAQLEVLAAVTENPGTRPSRLAARLHMRRNTVTTIVNSLTAKGMLIRTPSGGDRRAVELTASEGGRRAVIAWQATNAAVLRSALSALPPAVRGRLNESAPDLSTLAAAIDELADASSQRTGE